MRPNIGATPRLETFRLLWILFSGLERWSLVTEGEERLGQVRGVLRTGPLRSSRPIAVSEDTVLDGLTLGWRVRHEPQDDRPVHEDAVDQLSDPER